MVYIQQDYYCNDNHKKECYYRRTIVTAKRLEAFHYIISNTPLYTYHKRLSPNPVLYNTVL